MIEKILNAWCRNMHDAAMWPMHGKYTCRKCLREHPIEWADHRVERVLPAALGTAPASMDVCA